MFLLALLTTTSIVSFSLFILIDQLFFGVSWALAVPRALIATVLAHWLAWHWLDRSGRGKG